MVHRYLHIFCSKKDAGLIRTHIKNNRHVQANYTSCCGNQSIKKIKSALDKGKKTLKGDYVCAINNANPKNKCNFLTDLHGDTILVFEDIFNFKKWFDDTF